MKNQILTKQGRKDYEAFVNKQLTILKGHHERCMLRCFNEFIRISNKSDEKEIKEARELAIEKEEIMDKEFKR